MRGALNYNEDKVARGVAELIASSGFACDIDELGISQKLNRFNTLISNTTKVSYNTVHLSLNFAPGENLDTETLQQIARDYMARIGFANQPFLVYRHDDTSHPHIHIVTTPILKNGRSINIHNLAKRKSYVRKEIELEYGLVVAESRKKEQSLPLQPVSLQAVHYGQSETKKAISNIVQEVVARYKFTSLDELNAVLRQYNVFADRGGTGSRMYQKGGLVYSLVDSDGYKTGVPIKASSIFSNPTLSELQKKFKRNGTLKTAFQQNVQSKVLAALDRSKSTTEFMEGLKRRNVGLSVQYHSSGTMQHISFVDHFTKSVFSSDELGISVDTLLHRLNVTPMKKIDIDRKGKNPATSANHHKPIEHASNPNNNTESADILKILLTTDSHQPELSPEFLRKRKKKRKR
ncbi:relaxase/mobilization nuclease domain-containing protein [Niastella vici]|nr:relaxase/mobilization nuclease domain-containing protein [Niastella vici]